MLFELILNKIDSSSDAVIRTLQKKQVCRAKGRVGLPGLLSSVGWNGRVDYLQPGGIQGHRGILPIRQAVYQFVTHTGGGLFACPGGTAEGRFIGQRLFEAG